MVLVQGSGTVGMRGQPYGVVETAHLKTVDAPEKDCPAAIKATPGATACWVQTDQVDPVIGPREVSVAPFCIERFPFPGKGHPYAKDGLNVWTAQRFDMLLRTGRYGGRRFCTSSEFQLAVAGPRSNQRFIYGDSFLEGRCKGDKVGDRVGCTNQETGVVDYGAVHSHWTIADRDFVEYACGVGRCNAAGNRQLTEGMYVVMGGTGRVQTRQAPFTPHTWHDHGDATVDACGFQGWDDQPVVCADPGTNSAAEEEAWETFRSNVIEQGSLTKALGVALGAPICPD